MEKKICYCFNYTAEEIRSDVLRNGGHSTILARIIAEKQKGGCQCPTRHPEGR